MAENFVKAYKEAGGPVQFEKFEGMPHGFGNEDSTETNRMVQSIKEFIAKQL